MEMNTEKLLQKTHQVIDEYIRDLDNYTIEQLLQKPSEAVYPVIHGRGLGLLTPLQTFL